MFYSVFLNKYLMFSTFKSEKSCNVLSYYIDVHEILRFSSERKSGVLDNEITMLSDNEKDMFC